MWTLREGSAVASGGASGDALTVTAPVGVVDGDLVLIGAVWENDAVNVSGSDSLSALGGPFTGTALGRCWVFGKIASGEPGSYTLTPTTNGIFRSAIAVCYRYGSSIVVDDTDSSFQSTDSGPYDIPSLTLAGAARVTFGVFGVIGGSAVGGGVSGGCNRVLLANNRIAVADGQKSFGETGITNWFGLGTISWVGGVVAIQSDAVYAGGGVGGSLPHAAGVNTRPNAFAPGLAR